MKQQLLELLQQALLQVQQSLGFDELEFKQLELTKNSDPIKGDYASNLALIAAKKMGQKPRDLAQLLVDAMPDSQLVAKIAVAGPGFINIWLSKQAIWQTVSDILYRGQDYGRQNFGGAAKVHLEYVSANPTGPLHVGHGRGAVFGSSLASLLKFVGYDVHTEYYINDAGRQIDILATSVWLRYLEQAQVVFDFPSNGYRGAYIYAIAQNLTQKLGSKLVISTQKLLQDLPPDHPEGDKEAHIDALIVKAKTHCQDDYQLIKSMAVAEIIADIKDDLACIGVDFNQWFSESSLYDSQDFTQALDNFAKTKASYEQDGAIWFKATDYGDDKDRVLIRANKTPTYFAADVAYHLNKVNRGYTKLIDIMGADHHGYVSRLKGLLQAAQIDPKLLEVLLVQFAVLYRGDEKVQMSTRSGEFVTLRQLREEVGADAIRYFYVMRKANQHMDFDLELAKKRNNDNPVYYIQYAHARIHSVFKLLAQKGWEYQAGSLDTLTMLSDFPQAIDLVNKLAHYPDLLQQAANNYEPHRIAIFLKDVAGLFHSLYNSQRFLVANQELRNAWLSLAKACQQVLQSGLAILGISAPETM